jgi:hypothetical protein
VTGVLLGPATIPSRGQEGDKEKPRQFKKGLLGAKPIAGEKVLEVQPLTAEAVLADMRAFLDACEKSWG